MLNKFYIYLLGGLLILVVSCQQDFLQNPVEVTETGKRTEVDGMQRLKFQSTEQLQSVVNSLENSKGEKERRRILASTVEFSDGNEDYVSLYEANKNTVFNNLSSSDWQLINNDEDELEFEPADSIIADIHFTQLLNANREIQMRDSVYRYFSNGVAVTDEMHAYLLDSVKNIIAGIKPDPQNGPARISPLPNVNFYIVEYDKTIHTFEPIPLTTGDSSFGGGGRTGYSHDYKNGPLRVRDGDPINTLDIREVDYDDGGDGNWFHKLWTGLFGKNIVVLSKFTKNKQLNLNFYDQNYIIYSNIGTKIKMQKKVAGIWWNIRAEEMVHGWEMVCLDFTIPRPITPQFPKDQNNNPKDPIYMDYHFPFQHASEVLFHIPLVNYDFTDKNLNNAYQKACRWVWDRLEGIYKMGHNVEDVGLFSITDRHRYLFCGPNSERVYNKRSHEAKFFAKWMPGTYNLSFGFSNGNINFKSIKIDPDDNVCIDSGVVFGAIKYKGQWKAARIVKQHKE